MKVLETFECSDQIPYANFVTKSHSSPNFVSFFSFMKDYSSVLF